MVLLAILFGLALGSSVLFVGVHAPDPWQAADYPQYYLFPPTDSGESSNSRPSASNSFSRPRRPFFDPAPGPPIRQSPRIAPWKVYEEDPRYAQIQDRKLREALIKHDKAVANGDILFETQRYLTDDALFQPLHQDRPYEPASFESLHKGDKVGVAHTVFWPEPHVLDEVAKEIRKTMRRFGRTPLPVSGSIDPELKEVDYLWPSPVQHEDGSIGVSKGGMKRIWNWSIAPRVGAQKEELPMMYQMSVKTPQGDRHVMMTPVTPHAFTSLPKGAYKMELWVLHEAVIHDDEPVMAFLGGMLISHETEAALRHFGTIRPAFVPL